MIRSEALREYAHTLQKNGFTIYEPRGVANYFVYSRMVDGQECFGDVQVNDVGDSAYEHHMPIKPSRENGSSMWVESADELTVAAAELIARPSNSNYLVGRQKNRRDPRFPLDSGYVKWENQ